MKKKLFAFLDKTTRTKPCLVHEQDL